MKQFDSSIVGQPYSRVMSFGVRYTAPMTAAVQQPGARVVPDDELRITWSA